MPSNPALVSSVATDLSVEQLAHVKSRLLEEARALSTQDSELRARREVVPEAHLCVGCQDMLKHRRGR